MNADPPQAHRRLASGLAAANGAWLPRFSGNVTLPSFLLP